jgi:hypothetical protein
VQPEQKELQLVQRQQVPALQRQVQEEVLQELQLEPLGQALTLQHHRR